MKNSANGEIVGYKFSGNVTKADYEVMMPEIEAITQKEGSISVFLDIVGFEGEKMEALGDHFKMLHYLKKIDKIAVIGDKSWEKWMINLTEGIIYKSKFFYPQDSDVAWEWLKD